MICGHGLAYTNATDYHNPSKINENQGNPDKTGARAMRHAGKQFANHYAPPKFATLDIETINILSPES
jgi:hypothetical protein